MELELTAPQHAAEVEAGDRFEFGKNWASFLSTLTEERIKTAEESLLKMLDVGSLEGRSFLDIGCGSGLFSLAARRLGANVFSFDFDPRSVNCALDLRRRYFEGDGGWQIRQGSVLDRDFIGSLGKFDVVYSWGVLHHTGKMWEALDLASSLVKDDGKLFIAIYNDTGSQAARWQWIKRTYCRLPGPAKVPFAVAVTSPGEAKQFASSLLRGRPAEYFQTWRNYKQRRGMSKWHDIIDWVGGYPYEYAGAGAIFDFYKKRGFHLVTLKCDRVGLGCNEFVFQRSNGPQSD